MKNHNLLLERGEHSWSEDSIRLILTPSSTAKALYFYTQEVGYFKTHFPYFSERQNLDSFLIIYTISGTGYLEYNGASYTVTAGQCFFINCNLHHLYRTLPSDDWEFLWIHFNGANALGYYHEFTNNGFCIVSCRDRFFMERTLWRIIALHQKKDLTTELITSNLINSLLTELLVETATNNADTFRIPEYIRAITKEIDQHFREELPLSHFEEVYHRSRYYLLKEFRKYIGITIREYQIQRRINYAKELLKYTDDSVSEIAYKAGMNNVTHFINLFKAREQMTPLVYRKFWQE